MDIEGIHRFFNLGHSLKQQNWIGEKELGTKTYFRSKRITVRTQTRDGKRYEATMDSPWEMLKSNVLPKYSLNELPSEVGRTGTIISIEGYIIDSTFGRDRKLSM